MATNHSMEELHLLCRLRSTLEAFALATVRARADWPVVLAALQRRLPELKELAQRGGQSAFHEADTDFARKEGVLAEPDGAAPGACFFAGDVGVG